MMDGQRFAALADAYGADIGRWPTAIRDAARAFGATDGDAANRTLARARALDDLLRQAPSSAPGRALRERILRAGPKPPALRRVWRWLVGAGIGSVLAGAGAVGVAVGVVLAPMALAMMDRSADPDPANEAARFLREPTDMTEG